MANFNISYKFQAIDDFSADARKVSESLNKVSAEVKKVQSRYQKLREGMSRVGKSMLLRVTAPLIGAATSAVYAAGKFEQMQMQFESMYSRFGDGAERARKEMEYLGQFSAKSPFRLANMVAADQVLQNMGFSAKEAHAQLKQLGDLTASQPENLKYMASLIGRVRARGHIYARQIHQFTLLRVPVLDELRKMAAEKGHKGVDIFKIAQTGGITYKTFETAMSRITGKGGMFYQHMILQSKTLLGLITTFKDAMYVNFLVPLGRTIMDTLDLKKHLAHINQILLSAGGKIEKWAKSHKKLAKLITYTVIALAAIAPVLITLGLLADGFAAAIAIVTSPITLIVAGIAAIAFGLYYAYKHSKKFQDTVHNAWKWMKALWKQLEPLVKILLKIFVELIQEAWVWMKEIWKIAGPLMVPAFKLLWFILRMMGKSIYYTILLPLKEVIKLLGYLDRPINMKKISPAAHESWGESWRKSKGTVKHWFSSAPATTGAPAATGPISLAPIVAPTQKHHLQISIKDPGKHVANTGIATAMGLTAGFDTGANMAHAR